MNDLLSNILIQPKVITKENCEWLVNYAKNAHQEQMGVFDAEKTMKSNETQSKIDKKSRDVKCADIEPIMPQIYDLMKIVLIMSSIHFMDSRCVIVNHLNFFVMVKEDTTDLILMQKDSGRILMVV